ncbi:MAG: C10 family peptidase [Treponema sp.]|jgi:hypothetical protein|nr:C10 family peptidase [Treponema sp.]
MKIKFGLATFLLMLMLSLSNSGFLYNPVGLYAQESGDRDDSPQVGGGLVIIPGDDELQSLLRETPNPRTVVGPLLQTKWSQGAPYNSMLPGGNVHLIPGCDVIAAAQIMKFHQHPVRTNGQSEAYTMRTSRVNVPSVNLNAAYDWNNMLNSYRSDGGDSNEQQRNAIARLIYHIGVLRKKDFTTGYSDEGGIDYPAMLTTIFGFDKNIQHLSRADYSDAAWENIIRSQLNAGLPVFYWGNNQTNTSPHTFIIDGYEAAASYDNTGRFHINMGWGGRYDGWYSLNAISPGSSDFNYAHNMYINVKPDAGGAGSNEWSLNSFTAGKTSVSQNEMFTVSFRPRSAGFFPSGQLGMTLADNNGNIVEVIGTRNTGVMNPGSGWVTSIIEMNCFVPETVRPGQYRLMAISRATGGDWKTITVSNISSNVPSAINLTVTAERGAAGGGYGIALVTFNTSKTTVSQNELFTVSYRPRSLNNFSGGQVGAALVDSNNNIVQIIGTMNRGALTAGQNWNLSHDPLVINCYVPETVNAGQYRLRIVVRPTGGEWRVATLAIADIPTAINFTVTAGIANSGGYGLAFASLNIDGDIVSASRGARFNVNYSIRNPGTESFEGSLRAVLIDNAGNETVIGTRTSTSFDAGSGRTSFVGCTIPNTIALGNYQLRIAVRPAGGEWRIVTMSIDGVPASIGFMVR